MKSFITTDSVIVAYVHGAYFCFKNETCNERCAMLKLKTSQVNHYRNKVMQNETNESITETIILRFKDELIEDVNGTLIATGFKP
jgi:hypothetical protein